MNSLTELKKHLKVGQVYRRSELSKWSKSLDRHLTELTEQGFLEKVFRGMYYVPKNSTFGKVPPNEYVLVRSFLKDDHFLLFSPNIYNTLGVGTTQLYNKRIVYNHKRQGSFKLGNRDFDFQMKRHFPLKITEEFLLIDLSNNIENLAEDRNKVIEQLLAKALSIPVRKLKSAVKDYGSAKTKDLFKSIIQQ